MKFFLQPCRSYFRRIATFLLPALILLSALPQEAEAAYDDCPALSSVGHTLALNMTDGECFNGDTGPFGPNSDTTEDYVVVQMADGTGGTNFQINDQGADSRTLSYVVNGSVTVNSAAPNYTVNCSSGCSISGTHGATSFSFTYTDTGVSGSVGSSVGPPSDFGSSTGSGQSAAVSTGFSSPLTVVVEDTNGNPVSGVSVTFTAPGSGASGTFSGGGASEVISTDGSGLAVECH